MADNPFGEPDTRNIGRNYLMLVSVKKDNMTAVQKALDNLKKTVDKNAQSLWIDSRGIGVFITTGMVASEIRAATFQGVSGDFTDIKDAVVIEIGSDWYASDETNIKNWLTAHAKASSTSTPEPRTRNKKESPW